MFAMGFGVIVVVNILSLTELFAVLYDLLLLLRYFASVIILSNLGTLSAYFPR
jgi:hypothetical protein